MALPPRIRSTLNCVASFIVRSNSILPPVRQTHAVYRRHHITRLYTKLFQRARFPPRTQSIAYQAPAFPIGFPLQQIGETLGILNKLFAILL